MRQLILPDWPTAAAAHSDRVGQTPCHSHAQKNADFPYVLWADKGGNLPHRYLVSLKCDRGLSGGWITIATARVLQRYLGRVLRRTARPFTFILCHIINPFLVIARLCLPPAPFDMPQRFFHHYLTRKA